MPEAPRSLSLLAAILCAGPALAGAPVALVVEGSPDATPPIASYSELGPGDVVQLPAGAEIEFLSYLNCETVRVRGGRLSFSDRGHEIQGGELVRVERQDCPDVVSLSRDGVAAGTTLRSEGLAGEGAETSATLVVPERPRFLLVRELAQEVEKLRIARDGQLLMEAQLEGSSYDWPADLSPLETGAYHLTLDRREGEPLRFRLEVSPAEASPVTLLRIE